MNPASRAALSYLLGARDPDGWWRDFDLAAGQSDEWVTGYVGVVMASLGVPAASQAASDGWRLLASRDQRGSGLWGYNELTPGDADSTAWGLQLAGTLGLTGTGRAQRATTALAAHYRPDGGIAAYATDELIRPFIRAAPDVLFAGWCGSQTCVTAAVAALRDFRDAVRPYLLSSQQPGGRWMSYWWQDDEYATALAAEGFVASGIPSDEARVAPAITWACERLDETGSVRTTGHPEGSPFATAWCLRLLSLSPNQSSVALRVVDWLYRVQRPDGSWMPSARLRLPLPDDRHPERFTGWNYAGRHEGSVVTDRGIFTTATVLQALARFF